MGPRRDGNASSAFVQFPSGMVSTLTNATFQVWVNFYGGPVWQELFSFGTNYNGAGVTYTTLIPHNGANGNLRWSINEGGETFVDAPSELTISNEVSVTVAYNYSAQSASLYVNGRKVGSGPMSKPLFNIPDVDNFLGKSQFSADPYFQGALDEFRIYSGVKSDLQVAIDATTGPNNIVTNPGNLASINVSAATNIDAHATAIPVQVIANFANVPGVDVSTIAYIHGRQQLDRTRRTTVEVFKKVDVIITPTSPISPPPITDFTGDRNGPPDFLNGNIRNTSPFDVYGWPTISVPSGFTASGLPIGLQISAAPGADAVVLQVAHAYEQATEWHRRIPSNL